MGKKYMRKIEKKEKRKYTTNEVKRYLGILAEDFESKVKAIAEQYLDIKNDIKKMKKTLDLHSRLLDSHSRLLESHSRILDSHSRILNSHTEMIASIQETLEIMKVDIQFIKSGLKKKVDLEEFQTLEKRVALLEAKIRIKP